MKNIFIISTAKIYRGNTAGSLRMMHIAKSLAFAGNYVYLCSANHFNISSRIRLTKIENNIFSVGEEKEHCDKLITKLSYILKPILYFIYLIKLNNLLIKNRTNQVIYLYPQTLISMDIACLILLKFFNRYKIYCDVNELRRAELESFHFSNNKLKRLKEVFFYIYRYLKFRLVEHLTIFYDGLIVISINLDNYFKRYNKNTIRIPILSNTEKKLFSKSPIFDINTSFKICFTGWISLEKEGFDILYHVLSSVKAIFNSIELHLYGPIRDHEKKKLLLDIPTILDIVENIKYHGIVEQEMIIPVMQKYHLLILPRPLNLQTYFGFSTKLSEYLISGVPALITDVSDNGLFVKDGHNGFIVKAGDPLEMENKLLYIINNYNKISDSIVNNAFNTSRRHFHYSNYSTKLSDFLIA